MFSFFNKQNFSTNLFVATSLLVFFMLGFFYFVLVFSQTEARLKFASNNTNNTSDNLEKYYLNYNYNEKDPFITKNPSLEDMLTGPIVSRLDPIMGSREAPVSIVEFADYTCQFCYQQEQLLKKVIKDYGDKVNLVWKDYPEGEINSISWQAGVAARCAGEQGKFWQYHDLLFNNHDKLNSDLFLKIAADLNLDIAKFKKCQQGKKVIALIKDNIDEANALDINGVPFIYVNNQEIMGYMGEEDLRRVIDVELNKNQNTKIK